MKPRRLRTCIAHRARRAAPAVSSGDGWRPLTLAWRRSPRRFAAAMASRARTILQQHFHSYATLQFAWSATPATPATHGGSRTHAAPSRSSHIDTRLELTRRETHRTHLQSRHVETRSSASTRRELIERTRTLIRATAPLIARRPTPVVSTRTLKSTAVNAPQASAPLRARPRAPLEHARAAAVTRPAAPPAVPRAKQATPPPPLVWRHLPPASAAPTAGTRETAAADEVFIERPAAKAPPASTPPVVVAQQLREAVRANVMDAAVMDRLADDVLKRVEKRMRIERERRGL